jgi:hypothetical protein
MTENIWRCWLLYKPYVAMVAGLISLGLSTPTDASPAVAAAPQGSICSVPNASGAKSFAYSVWLEPGWKLVKTPTAQDPSANFSAPEGDTLTVGCLADSHYHLLLTMLSTNAYFWNGATTHPERYKTISFGPWSGELGAIVTPSHPGYSGESHIAAYLYDRSKFALFYINCWNKVLDVGEEQAFERFVRSFTVASSAAPEAVSVHSTRSGHLPHKKHRHRHHHVVNAVAKTRPL